MQYWEIAVETTDMGTELVSGAFMAAGIEDLTIEESHEAVTRFLDSAKLYWDFADTDLLGSDVPRVIGYADTEEKKEEAVARLRAALDRLRAEAGGVDPGSLLMTVRRVDDADWLNNWKKTYRPIPIGQRLVIVPSWEADAEAEGRTKLVLDPGMAFGTGAHHTTRMCLEMIERNVREGDTVADLGCGSGILSIAALLLGARSAVGVDIDPLASDISSENAARNGIGADRYVLCTGDVLTDGALRERIAGRYDITVANIVADVIIRLAPYAKTITRPGGLFICSGIIAPRLEEVARAVEEAGFTILERRRREDWAALLAEA